MCHWTGLINPRIKKSSKRTDSHDSESASVSKSTREPRLALQIPAEASRRSIIRQTKTTQASQEISRARIPRAHRKASTTIKSAAAVSSELDKLDTKVAFEVDKLAAKVPSFALEGWGLGDSSSSDEEEPVAARPASGKSKLKGGAPSKDKYLASRSAAGDLQEEKLPVNKKDKFMSGPAFDLPSSFDPFADAQAEDAASKDYVHLRVQQRNGRKTLTTLQGLGAEYNYAKVLRDLKKEFCCNGHVVEDKELGKIIQLQGDHRKNVAAFLASTGMVKKDNIKVHGF